MAAKPFESRIQNLVYNVDVGIGLRIIKAGLYFLFIFFVLAIFAASQFHGLREAEAMDYAQLGRNLMVHKQLVTQNIRPASMAYLQKHGKFHQHAMDRHPDIVHPPLYPVVLAAAFKMTGVDLNSASESREFAPDKVVIGVGLLFTVLSGFLVYLIGRQLFEPRVALLSTSLFFLSNTVWGNAISGLNISLLMFWSLLCFYTAVVSVARYREGGTFRQWFLPFLISLLACIAAFLTRYAGLVLLPGLMLLYGVSFGRRGWPWMFAVLGIFLLGVSPWLVRNLQVSGGVLGLTPQLVLSESSVFEGDALERSLNPVFKSDQVVKAVQHKLVGGLEKQYSGAFFNLGEGILAALFFASFLFRFSRFKVHLLRWGVLLSMIVMMVLASLYGETTIRSLQAFWPFVLLYGVAFFYLLLDRLQLKAKIFRLAVMVIFFVLTALPYILTIMPPRTTVPYPPYSSVVIGQVTRMLEPQELLCTDMPWATAWYGGRTSVQLPRTVDEFYTINDNLKRFSGLYFTPVSRNLPYARTLLTGPYREWFRIMNLQIPQDFPLTEGLPIINADQLFLSDRRRWLGE